MKINEIVQEGVGSWLKNRATGVGTELFKDLAGSNATLPSFGRVNKHPNRTRITDPLARYYQTAEPTTFSEPVGLPGQEQYVKGPDGWVSAADQTTPAPENLIPVLDKALGQGTAPQPAQQPVATPKPAAQQAQPAPATKPTPAPKKPTATAKPAAPTPSRSPTHDQSLMVQQMRQQQGLPTRVAKPAAPTQTAPTTPVRRPESTMVQQMRQQAANAAKAKQSVLLKAPRPTYGQPSTGGTPIPLTPAERMPQRTPQVYRNPVQHESIDLAEVLWQKMKRLQANES